MDQAGMEITMWEEDGKYVVELPLIERTNVN